MQWYGSLLPRLHPFLPAGVVLEIAPGFGRWTRFLKDHCDRLIAVDVTEKCVEHCRERFASSDHVECHLNDGRSLPMVATASVDLAVSFDSLVHVEDVVIDAYASELSRTLSAEGVAVIHHSNQGSYPDLDNPHNRATSMTAPLFAEIVERHGLVCVGQELIDWGGSQGLIDSISIATRPGSRWDRERVVIENGHFMEEAARLARLAEVYGGASFGGTIATTGEKPESGRRQP